MKSKHTIDLHGVKHSDVEIILENFFFWENPSSKQVVEIITGRSSTMQKIVINWLDSHEYSYYIPAYNIGTVYVN